MEQKVFDIAGKLAQQFNTAMVPATRRLPSGDDETFYRLADGSPQWMTDLVRAAHLDMLPNDWSYSMIDDILGDLVNNDADEWDEKARQFADENVDIYNHELLSWFGSHFNRVFLCDEARENGYVSENADMFKRITAGQGEEYAQIAHVLISGILEKAEAEFFESDEETPE